MLRIKEVAKEKGFTITALAEKMGMLQVSLSRIINGNPTMETLLKIAEALDVDIRDLFITTRSEENEALYIVKNGVPVEVGHIDKSKL